MGIESILMFGGIGFAVFLLVVTAVWVISLRRVVPTNMVHIVQTKKASKPYGRGKESGNVYYQWPAWIPIIGLTVTEFPESIFDVSLIDYDAYDSGRLPFMVDVKAFFRVELAETAAQRVASFAELKTQLQDVLRGAVRRILATNELEQIMQDRAKLGDEFTAEVNHQLQEWGVTTVKSIEFMDIRDSKGSTVITEIMAKEKSRIEMESRITVAENLRAAEEREIEATRQVDIQRQDAEQQVGVRTAVKEQTVGIAEETSKQQILVAAKTTTEKNMEVKRVEEVVGAQIAKDVAIVKANQDKEVKIVEADADKQQTVIAAEAKKAETETIAQGDLTAAKFNAEGIQATGLAEAEAKKALELAPVQAQIVLAKEIGENAPYQGYLIQVEQIKAGQVVGVETAKALANADLKVIANSGDPVSGVTKLGDLFTPTGGTSLTGMLSALSQTPEGSALVNRLTGGNNLPSPDAIAEAVVEKVTTKARPKS